MKENAISLEMLKDLFELIPANNQLIITEAGNTNDFGRKFVKTLLEGTNSIKHLSKKNRVIITPKNIGLDGIHCKLEKKQGPINCFITSLPLSHNIFGIFKNSKNLNQWDTKDAKEIENAILQNELEAKLKDYTSIFFERQLLDDLEYYIPEQNSPSRGAQSFSLNALQKTKTSFQKKHALLIGVNHYESSTQWNPLINPKIDVEAIAKVLKNDYGYDVQLFINATEATVHEALLQYSTLLNEEDQLLIFFAGHGDFDPHFDDGFVVLANSKTTLEDPFRRSYIQFASLQKLIPNPKIFR